MADDPKKIAKLEERIKALEAQVATLEKGVQFRETLLDSIREHITATDTEGRITYVNAEVCRNLGKNKADIIGQSVRIFAPPEYGKAEDEMVKKTIELGEWRSEIVNRGAGNSESIVDCHTWLVRDEAGRPKELIGIAIDITESKKTAAAFKVNESRLLQIINLVPHFIFAKDAKGRFVLANKAVAEAYGTTVENLLGKTDTHFAKSKAEVDHFQSDDFDVLQLGQPKVIPEELITDSRGQIRFLSTTKIPFIVSGTALPAVLGVSVDITERKQAEKALRESQNLYQLLADNARDLISLHDLEGKYVYASPSFKALLGYSFEDLAKRSVYELIHPDDIPVVRSYHDNSLAGGNLPAIEYRLLHKGGYYVWFETITRIISDHNLNQSVQILATSRDITERKVAEAAISLSENRFLSLYQSMCEGVALHELVFDRGGKISDYRLLDVNTAYSQITGIPREKALHSLGSELYGTGQAPYLEEFSRPCFTQAPSRLETFFAPMGKHFQISIAPLGPNRFATIFFDITEQKLYQEELKHNEARLQALLRLNQASSSALQGFANLAIDGALRLTHSRLGFLAFIDEGGSVVTVYTGPGSIGSETPTEERPVVCRCEPNDFWSAVFSQRRSGINNHCTGQAPWKGWHPLEQVDIARYMTAPIIDGGRIVAVAGVGNRETPYSDADARQLQLLMEGVWQILERKRAEEALVESEQRWKFALEGARDGVWDWDLSAGKFFYSRRWKALLGYEENEIGVSLDEWEGRLHPEDVESTLRALQSCLKGSTPYYQAEHRLLCKDGSYKWILARGFVLSRDQQGEPLRILGTHTDISDQKALQEELSRSRDELEQRVAERTVELRNVNQKLVAEINERLQAERQAEDMRTKQTAILNNIQDIAWLKDKEGRFIAVNEPFARAAGFQSQEMLGKTDFEIWPRELAASYVADDREVMESKKSKRIEERILRKDGTVIEIETIKTPIFDSYQGIIGTTGIARDVSERKALEEKLRQAEKLASLGTLAAGIAHEINNPLGIILMSAQEAEAIAKDSSACTGVLENLEEIKGETRRCAAIVKSVLQFARQASSEKWLVEPQEVIDRVVAIMLTEAEQRGVTVCKKIKTPLQALLMNPTEIEQVLINLISNAIHASAAKSQVEVSAACVSGYLEIEVADRGAGISQKDLAKIFDPFYTTRRKEGGTGLGLSISHGIVSNHGGTLQISSAVGVGTTAIIKLPL